MSSGFFRDAKPRKLLILRAITVLADAVQLADLVFPLAYKRRVKLDELSF